MNINEFYKNKTILVTGGVGYIGSALVKQLLQFQPHQIRIFDNRETELFHSQHLLKEHHNVRYLVGDVRDKERVMYAAAGCDIVFHAAALKHVPSCEYNPSDAVKTNILGTQNVIEAAMSQSVKKVIFISTDKAVNPTNTMGATKLVAERLMLNAQVSSPITKFSCVRFGNVLNSRGSVIPLFESYIVSKQPIPLTHEHMDRFFMPTDDAINLILESGSHAEGKEIFILKMAALKIKDLAEVIREHHIDKGTIGKNESPIVITGVRPGEKLSENLMTDEEARVAEEQENMFIIRPELELPHVTTTTSNGKARLDESKYNSHKATHLTKQEIKKLLTQHKIL
ncbi:MAG: polysaccharide biosynthesis protein [Nanoarchaeota archaeon]